MNRHKIAVVGGGIQGLSLAYFLSKNPQNSVALFERDQRLGGLLCLCEVAGTPFEGFYHHILACYRDIIELAEELNLGDKLFSAPAKTGIFYQNRIYPFSGAGDLLRFSPLSFFERLRFGAATLILRLIKNPKQLERVTAADWVKKFFGERAYRVVWEPLLRGKFGERAGEIAMSWLWGRIHERSKSPFLLYPRGGFQQLIDKMAEKIIAASGLIRTGAAVEEIEPVDGKLSVKIGGKEEIFDKVFVTAPIPVFLRLAKKLPPDYVERLKRIEYRAAHVTVLVLKEALMTDGYYWLNVNDRDSPLLAVIEHTNFLPKEDYGGKTIVYLGNYPDPADPIMKMSDSEAVDLCARWLPKVNPRFQKEWIEKCHIFKDSAAQPIVRVGYKETIPPYETPIPNLYLVTMAQIYPWDRSTSHAVEQGKKLLDLN